MSQIPPHFWLKILPEGLQAKQARSLRMEDRELLTAIGSSPSRVLDVFRRLRWTDSQAFQDSLSHMVMRQWIAAGEERQDLGKDVSDASPEPDMESSDPLMALLARHAQQAPDFQGHDDFLPEAMPDAGPSPETEGTTTVEGPEGIGPAPLASDQDGAGEEKEEESSTVSDSDDVQADAPSSGAGGPDSGNERPSSYVQSPGDVEALFSAMGVQAPVMDVTSDEPNSSEKAEVSGAPSPSHDALLKALLRGDQPVLSDPVVEVPAYELPSADSLEGGGSDGFVRLRDMEAQASSSSRHSPEEKTSDPMTPAERRRQQARQQMLDEARREKAQRQAAKERAQEIEARRQAEAEKREQALKHQRAVEASQRGSTFLSRAERARRIRDGLPLDTDKKD